MGAARRVAEVRTADGKPGNAGGWPARGLAAASETRLASWLWSVMWWLTAISARSAGWRREDADLGEEVDLLSGARINVSATEATLGYRLRQYHVGVVCWAEDAAAAVDNVTRLEHAITHVAGKAACAGEPVFLPRDESSAWAWLPLGIRDTFDAAEASTAGADSDIHFAFGDAAKGTTGFRLTHSQALAAQAVALAAGSSAVDGSIR